MGDYPGQACGAVQLQANVVVLKIEQIPAISFGGSTGCKQDYEIKDQVGIKQGENSERSFRIEGAQIVRKFARFFFEQNPRNKKSRKHEKQRHSSPTQREAGKVQVEEHYKQDGDSTYPIEGWYVSHLLLSLVGLEVKDASHC
jgi:hypothetical protein